jgi:hypothetical protein
MRGAVEGLVAVVLFAVVTVDGRDTQLRGWFDLPVVGGASTLAALGIPLDERALTLSIASRLIYGRDSRLGMSPDQVMRILANAKASDGEGERISVPAPLTDEIWRRLLAIKSTDDLFARLLADRNALVLAVGLTATDDSMRALLTRDRDLLRALYRDFSGAFHIVARHLRLKDDRVDVPGGAGADFVWEKLAGASPARPAAFLRSLLAKDQGRLAWYYDTVAGMDAARLAIVWPAGSASARLDYASALYETFRDSEVHWRIPEQPFRRNLGDAASVVMALDIADGRLTGPTSARLWELLFDSETVDADRVRRALRGDSAPVSIAALTRAIVSNNVRERRIRFEMFRLAQRVFPNIAAEDLGDVAVAVSGYRHYRSLLLALERMQITTPETWAMMVAAARHVATEASDAEASLQAFQGAVAIVERIRHVRTIDIAIAERVLRALSEAVRSDRRVTRSIGQWIVTALTPALPLLEQPDAWTGKAAYESTILQALAGPRECRTPTVEWEGLSYKVDLVAAELDRLRAVRKQLPSPGLDDAIERDKPRELAAAITTLVYATALGDSEGPVALSREIATRHDFGFDQTALLREVMTWAPPEEQQGLGAWRVQGALIGLDLGLSRLSLRRVADQQMPLPPTLTLNDFGTLTRTIVAMVASELSDTDRDEIAAAIARGRKRVTHAALSLEALDPIVREARASAVVRQLLPWIITRQPDAIDSVFSLRDLLWLGTPALSRDALNRWGVSGEALDGRRITAMPPPAPWEDFSGRPDLGQIATQVPDITLRIVEETARLKLPAMLVPSLLAFAIEDYWHDVQARFSDDWPRMIRQAAALDASRVEDYVAALTGNGPLRAQ